MCIANSIIVAAQNSFVAYNIIVLQIIYNTCVDYTISVF